MLVLIAVFGLASVGFARYEYRHPPAGPTANYAALAFYACGTSYPSLPASAGKYHAITGGVVASSSTGTPTLDQFVAAYPTLTLTSSKLGLPAPAPTAKKKHPRAVTYTNDEKCPAGTRDAGKVGHVEIAYWPTLSSSKPTLTTNPGSVPITSPVQISVAFVPTGVTPPRPPAAIISNMEDVINGTPASTTTTSSTLPHTSTTVKASR